MTVLSLDIDWKAPPDGSGAGDALAWGAGLLSIDGQPVWYRGAEDSAEGVEWSWIELLEFLGNKWVYLCSEQAYPFGLTPENPSKLRQVAREQLEGPHALQSQLDDADEALYRFESRHDLARGLRGITLPSVMVVREGKNAWVSTSPDDALLVSLDQVLTDLEAIGNCIAQKLERAERSDRAKSALDGWAKRNEMAESKIIQLATGMSAREIRSSPARARLEFWELGPETGYDSELACAARMSGASPADRDTIIQRIRNIEALETPKLNDLEQQLSPILARHSRDDAYEQGYVLATAVRDELALGDGGIDPEAVLADLGVAVVSLELSESIEAVGCWGPRHGPVVFVNPDGRRASTPHGRRATLAHEICHLLADRQRSLPLAEVLGGRSPYLPERRANAFAAQLLLPQWQARNTYRKHKSVQKTLAELQSVFGVGRVLAANQLKNTRSIHLPQTDLMELDRIITQGSDELPLW